MKRCERSGLRLSGERALKKLDHWRGVAIAAAERVEDFGSEVTTLIRRHPIPALLIGFGVGLLLGRAARMV